jgi:hypothetical protein
MYAIEYPTYGAYQDFCPARISDKIKEDSLAFYDYLMMTHRKKPEDIYVMGRSIGSGGATYLASNRHIPLLILISPFDNIRSVAIDHAGCIGCLVKQHFDN